MDITSEKAFLDSNLKKSMGKRSLYPNILYSGRGKNKNSLTISYKDSSFKSKKGNNARPIKMIDELSHELVMLSDKQSNRRETASYRTIPITSSLKYNSVNITALRASMDNREMKGLQKTKPLAPKFVDDD